jgi:hypothetical protein
VLKKKKKSPPSKKNNQRHPNQSTSCHRAVRSCIYSPPACRPAKIEVGEEKAGTFLLSGKCVQLGEHALSGDRPRRGVCSPTATLAKQLEPRGSEVAAGVAASLLPGISEPPKVSVPAPARSLARPGPRRGARAAEGGGRPRPEGAARGGRVGRGAREGHATAPAPRWQGRGPRGAAGLGAPGPAVTAPRGAATHRLAPRPPPRRRSTHQSRAPRSPIYRLRGSRSGGRLPPSPPASPFARLRALPLPAGPRGQPLSAAPLPPSPPGRAPPGLARAPDAASARTRARGDSPPPPPTPAQPGPAPRLWPGRQVLPPEGPAGGSLRVALAQRASSTFCGRGAGTGRERLIAQRRRESPGARARHSSYSPDSEVDLKGD